MDALRKKRFQLSSLSPEIKELLKGYIKKLGGTYLDKQIFSRQVSHVVCGKPNRSEKYLGGCISGRWVLKKEYLEDSFRQGRWLCEEDYEWSTEDIEQDNSMRPLYSAPRKWRNALKNNEGGFKNWHVLVHVKDIKMKKAYERLLEAGCATISKKTATYFQDSNHAKEVTHVFVEADLKCDVVSLEKSGVPCLSPDYIPEYIIQVANEQVMNNLTMTGSDLTNIMSTIKLPSKSASAKEKGRGVLPGKENGPVGKENGPMEKENGPMEMNKINKKGIKRKSPVDSCDMCQTKRQKKMIVSFPHCQTFVQKNDYGKGKNKSLFFPVYVSSIVESCVEEGYIIHALESLSSSLSNKHAPSSGCLYMIMNQFLLNSPSKYQAMKSYHLLQKIILLHPPSSCQSLYLRALKEPNDDIEIEEDILSSWKFVHKVIGLSFGAVHNNDKTNTRVQENAGILLPFFDNLFKQDINACPQTPMLLQILWPTGMVSAASKQSTKEFARLCVRCVKLAVNDNTKLVLCQVLLDLLSLALTSLRNLNGKTGKECCEFLAQQLFVVMCKDGCNKTVKLFLQGCHSSWLKMRITELTLGNFDKVFIPQIYRTYSDKTLSLMKIVCFYSFLLPKTTDKSTQNASENLSFNQNDVKSKNHLVSKKLRRNEKGETPLHAACIHNDVAKVEEILEQGFDVNTTDYAGWTALHEACNYGHVQCVEKILDYHEEKNDVDFFISPLCGTTVLHDAVANNHLAIAKLLVKSGGLRLLQAKTATGKTAVDLAVTREMINFLTLEMNRLEQEDKQLSNDPQPQQILQEEYNKIMNKHNRVFVTMADCQEYLFLVSQLLQAYIQENMLPCTKLEDCKKTCKNCKADVECYGNLGGYVDSIEQHIKLITGKQELSQICQVYFTSIKECLLHV